MKKKSAGLDDYIVVKNNKRQNIRDNSRQKQTNKISQHKQTKISMVSTLKQQDEYQSDEDE